MKSVKSALTTLVLAGAIVIGGGTSATAAVPESLPDHSIGYVNPPAAEDKANVRAGKSIFICDQIINSGHAWRSWHEGGPSAGDACFYSSN